MAFPDGAGFNPGYRLVKAWIDPEGYRRFIAQKKRAFEDQLDLELGVKK